MSILSELDPQNNRARAKNPHGAFFWLWWLLVLPLLLAVLVWWLYRAAPESAGAGFSSPDLAVSTPEGAANKGGGPASDSAAGRSETPALTNENEGGSAVILSGEGGMNDAADPAPPQAVSSETPEAIGANGPSSSAAIAAAASETKISPPAVKRAAVKDGKAKKANVAANQPKQDATEKAKERDVDIISVIIR